jgi:Fe-S oxidoreductase
MLRAKAKKFRDGKLSFRDKLLTSTDRVGKLATIPVVVEFVNAVNRTPVMRKAMQATLGIAAGAALPPYAKTPLRDDLRASVAWPVRDGSRTPGKVAIFTTCYVNYNEPGIGRDLVRILEHNAIPYAFTRAEACCGMPKLEVGDFEKVRELMETNLPALARFAREGYAILTPVPSCTLMWKQELPLLFPDDEDVKLVRDAMFDPFEYFVLRDKDGFLSRDFKRPLGKVNYHIPCHARVQNVGQKTREALSWVPGTEVTTVERCAGHDGSYGVKAEFFATSMKIGKPVFARMGDGDPDYISSDCPIAGRRIRQGIEDAGEPMRGRKEHPLTLLRMAYGID